MYQAALPQKVKNCQTAGKKLSHIGLLGATPGLQNILKPCVYMHCPQIVGWDSPVGGALSEGKNREGRRGLQLVPSQHTAVLSRSLAYSALPRPSTAGQASSTRLLGALPNPNVTRVAATPERPTTADARAADIFASQTVDPAPTTSQRISHIPIPASNTVATDPTQDGWSCAYFGVSCCWFGCG